MAISRTAVPVDELRRALKQAAVSSRDGGAYGFASLFNRAHASLIELELENRHLRERLEKIDAQKGLNT